MPRPKHKNDPARIIGRAIRSKRNKYRWTLRQIADKAGIEPSHLQKIELGQTNPSYNIMLAILEAVNINPEKIRGVARLKARVSEEAEEYK